MPAVATAVGSESDRTVEGDVATPVITVVPRSEKAASAPGDR